jgi:hypothetical protein
MITDDILGQKRKFNPSRKPMLVEWKEDPSKLDPELKKLKHVMVHDTEDNREFCFWTSSIAQTFTIMMANQFTGTGLRVRSSQKKYRDIVKEWNEEINVNRKTIEDYYLRSWIDEIVHAGSYWRTEFNKDVPTNIDIQRIDPKTITIKKDRKYGWEKLIQTVPNYKSYRSKASFYARARLYDKDFDEVEPHTYYRQKEIHIPDEPDVVIRTNIFIRPPIGTALHYITYKRYILYFMRKYSQKFWTPFILYLIGDPKTNYYPDNDDDMQEQIDDVAEVAPNMVNFGSLILPGNVRAEELGKQGAKSSEIYVKYMDALDKQTAIALYNSMGLIESSGNELSTQRGVKETRMQFIEGIRRRYKMKLERFYLKCLLPANGIKASPGDIDLEYPPLKFEASEEYMRAVELGRKTGMFLDRNELRKAGQTVWDWLEAVAEKDNAKINFQIPIQTSAGLGGAGGAGNSTRSTAQKTRQKVKPVASTTHV